MNLKQPLAVSHSSLHLHAPESATALNREHKNKLRHQKIGFHIEEIAMKPLPEDAIEILKADHQKVKELFKEFEGLSDRSKVSKKRIADQICHELRIHTEVEEQVLYPAVRAAIKTDDLMDEALVEHASAKNLVAQITVMDPGDDLYDAKLKVLSEQIDHHVSEEEGQMFPKVRHTKIDLKALAAQMTELKETLAEQV